ncbi:MAG: ATP-binding cassette domain-containing protein [Cyanobacteria bacterium J06621_8]
MNVIELKNVNYKRQSKDRTFSLEDITFSVREGELVHLDGDIGAGKSTLIDLILGIREPDNGSIQVFGSDPGELKSRFLTAAMPQKLGSLIKNVHLGQLIDLIESHYPKAQDRVASVLEEFDLNLSRYSNKLSGGQERLLFFALVQAGSPQLLILDEPTIYLDTRDKEDKIAKRTTLRNHLKNFVDQGNTVLLVSHDPDAQAFFQPTRTLMLENGQLSGFNENEKSFTDKLDSGLINSIEIGRFHWVYLLFKHVKFNLLQTLQTDQKYLWLTFIASFLWAICISLAAKMGSSESSSSLYTIANAYSFYLAMTAANSTGNIVAEERQNEVLSRLIKTLPLPPIIYLSAKVIASWLITSLLILTMLFTTLICNVLSPSIFPSLSGGLILGIIPYLFIGVALGYLFNKPKSIQIAALMCSLTLTVPIFARPLFKVLEGVFEIPGKFNLAALIGDNIAAHSPIYHYIQLILYLGKSPEYDQYFWLHLFWLIWFTLISIFIALWVYWRASKMEAKA